MFTNPHHTGASRSLATPQALLGFCSKRPTSQGIGRALRCLPHAAKQDLRVFRLLVRTVVAPKFGRNFFARLGSGEQSAPQAPFDAAEPNTDACHRSVGNTDTPPQMFADMFRQKTHVSDQFTQVQTWRLWSAPKLIATSVRFPFTGRPRSIECFRLWAVLARLWLNLAMAGQTHEYFGRT